MSDSATPWTAAHEASPSMGFSRQEHWSGVPLPSPDINLSHIHKVVSAVFLHCKSTISPFTVYKYIEDDTLILWKP